MHADRFKNNRVIYKTIEPIFVLWGFEEPVSTQGENRRV